MKMKPNGTKGKRKIRLKLTWLLFLGLMIATSLFLWKELVVCGIARKIPANKEWNLVVVNEWNVLPENYDETLTLMQLSNGEYVDVRIYPDLQEMFNDMRAANIYPIVREGYRTMEEQKELLEERIQRYIDEGLTKRRAKKAALQYVAMPGYSEHHLGSAVDINADVCMSTNQDVYQWLARYAHEYGFILRYPLGKEDVTGINYEPWHYRYVGKEAARELYEREICLEEYFQ